MTIDWLDAFYVGIEMDGQAIYHDPSVVPAEYPNTTWIDGYTVGDQIMWGETFSALEWTLLHLAAIINCCAAMGAP